MANPEDPPFLTVGTEVSAKYRGAFCEATIKIVKKLVKCKVSYGKGQSALVTGDAIKGHLKVGAQVEVKQQDGQLLPATISKLTDQSTYTVVFDDGDERTLKRSSLCLKGGRHFHESESLDHLPLTDPENFGAPVIHSTSKKVGRKRRHISESPPAPVSSASEGPSPSKRACTYPSEFPVGKAVFLENDRRRSSWLPAVIVPAHYVLEPSEMTPDTICLRSFKDGRYFAATKKELHDFSPDKEPLLSVLEGEIQATYMCKPAIERAMAYLDTGELPWDMDLFDGDSKKRPVRLTAVETSTSEDEEIQHKEDSAEVKAFEAKLRQFHESRGTPIQRLPIIGQRELNLFQLYQLVIANGGMDKVTQEMKWHSLYLQLGLPQSTASSSIRSAYKKYLHQYEIFERNKAKGKETGGMARRNKPLLPSSDEEQDAPVQQDQPNHQDKLRLQNKLKPQDKTKHQDRLKHQDKSRLQDKSKQQDKLKRQRHHQEKVEEKPVNVAIINGGVEKARAQLKTVKVEKIVKVYKPPLPPPTALAEEEENSISDTKSECSDFEPSRPPMADSSWNGGEEVSDIDRSSSSSAGSLDRGLEQCPDGYKENDRILVLYGKGKTQRTYEAKVIGVEKSEDKHDYLVHYSGWNTRYDEWIESSRIAGKLTSFSKTRPHFNHKKKRSSRNTGNGTELFTPSSLPPGSPSSTRLLASPPALSATSTNTNNNTTTPAAAPIHRAIKKELTVDVTPSKVASASILAKLPSDTGTARTPVRGRGIKSEHHKAAAKGTTASPGSRGFSLTLNSSNEEDQPIEVKQEKNHMWSSPSPEEAPPPPPPPSSPPPADVAGSSVSTETLASPLSSPHTNPFLCSEKLPGLPLKHTITTPPKTTPPQAPVTSSTSLTEQPAAESLLSLSTAPPFSLSPSPSHSPTHSTPPNSPPCEDTFPPHSPKLEERECESRGESTADQVEVMETRETVANGLEDVEEQKSSESLSASDKDTTPEPVETSHSSKPAHQQSSPDGKRKHRQHEDIEDYERRKKSRQMDMNYLIDFSQLPSMSTVERISLIQDHLREVQRRWSDLKAEVAYIERKRRRAKRKEREAAQSHPNSNNVKPSGTSSPSPSSPHQTSLNSAISCH